MADIVAFPMTHALLEFGREKETGRRVWWLTLVEISGARICVWWGYSAEGATTAVKGWAKDGVPTFVREGEYA
jgi:hypothetical protein